MARTNFRSGKSRPARLLTLLGLIVIVGAVVLVWAKFQLSAADPGSKVEKMVYIASGSTAEQVAKVLAGKGIVISRYSILIAAHLGSAATRLKPGYYSISPSETPEQILNMMAEGRTDVVRVTFPEGFTLKQIGARLAARHLVDLSEFEQDASSQGEQFKAPDGFCPASGNLEGYLFPDTYDFLPSESVHDIIQDMVDRFDERIVRSHPEVSDWSPTLIVASLIEREAEVDEDRPLIAAVINNRLKLGMALDIDATVEYALPEHKTRLMFSDLKTTSAYNTYLHHGLPPGPICNPGQPSIEASLAPANVDFLYYVQGPDHKHIFSKTLAEQDRNIRAVRSSR